MRHAISTVRAGTRLQVNLNPGLLAWSLTSVSILIVIATFGIVIRAVIVSGDFRAFLTHQAMTPFLTIAFTLVGSLIASRVPKNPIGWIFLSVGILYALNALVVAYSLYGPLAMVENLFPAHLLNEWLGNWIWLPAIMMPATYVLLYFPDGQLPSPGWRFVSWTVSLGLALSVLTVMLHPGPIASWGLVSNPFGIPVAARFLEILSNLGILLLAIGFVSSIIALIFRFHRSRGIEREQMKWLVYALSLVVLGFVIGTLVWFVWPKNPLMTELSITLMNLTILGIAIAATIAILRYRLYDIDLIINRTLVYGLLTTGVIGIYVLVVGAVSVFFQQSSNIFVSLLATGFAAILFQPLRARLQRGVNRLMYGERDDPYAVLSGLDRRLEASLSPETTLPIVVETVAQALKLPYVAIELADQNDFIPSASFGLSLTRKDQLHALPLFYQNEKVGRLVLSPRGSGESFNQAEVKLLEDIARHVGVAANAVQLTANLQHSRERLVTAREEERRRISRELHDGLGPQLVSLRFKVDAAQNLLGQDQETVGEVLTQLKEQTKSALGDVRRIAYNLRPPALDQLGLIAAIREHITAVERPGGLEILLDAPEDFPALPAAVEVAAYRIVIEALTNVTIHAQASQCTIRLRANDQFEIEVSDNGCGLPENLKAGVGLSSMRERAAELGGTCSINDISEGGTQILARLPMKLFTNSYAGGEKL
jgi:two-component system NarL family sensor kinase